MPHKISYKDERIVIENHKIIKINGITFSILKSDFEYPKDHLIKCYNHQTEKTKMLNKHAIQEKINMDINNGYEVIE